MNGYCRKIEKQHTSTRTELEKSSTTRLIVGALSTQKKRARHGRNKKKEHSVIPHFLPSKGAYDEARSTRGDGARRAATRRDEAAGQENTSKSRGLRECLSPRADEMNRGGIGVSVAKNPDHVDLSRRRGCHRQVHHIVPLKTTARQGNCMVRHGGRSKFS